LINNIKGNDIDITHYFTVDDYYSKNFINGLKKILN